MFKRVSTALLVLAAACSPVRGPVAVGQQQQAIELCDSDRVELTTSADPRFLSTGLISNGCTGFLIDAEHVVAAAHCFVNDFDGRFQLVAPYAPSNPTPLKFYPNFHPDRVNAAPRNVPRGDIDRVVVGSRSNDFPANDWGIAHIARWHDVDVADLTFARLDGTLQNAKINDYESPDKDDAPERGPIENPAYVRGAFDGHPDLIFDDTTCPDADQNGTVGMWQLRRGQEPDGELRGCNQRWMAGSIFSNCELVTVRDDVVLHDCETWGGSSGSPYIREKNGVFSVVGVGHGYASPLRPISLGTPCVYDGGTGPDLDCGLAGQGIFCGGTTCLRIFGNDQMPTPPQCLPNDHRRTNLNAGASASRFVDAPRFASNVAVARRPDGKNATAVFAVDSDLNRVVFRERQGLKHDDRFSFWAPLPPVGASEAKLSRIAACSDQSGHPMVFVVAKAVGKGASLLFRTRFDPGLGAFASWSRVTLANLDASLDEDLVDVDAAYDDKGNCLLFALDRGEQTVSFTDMTRASWASPSVSWTKINPRSDAATGDRLTALRNEDGFLWVVTIDVDHNLWALGQECLGNLNAFFEYPKLPDHQGVFKWLDADLFWNDKGEGRLIALPLSHDNQALVQFELPKRTCGQRSDSSGPVQPGNDRQIFTRLWTPHFVVNGVPQTARRPFLTSITASRWMEDKPGDVSPLVMGTDDFGNVYFISDTVNYGWNLKWQSFNHEIIFRP